MKNKKIGIVDFNLSNLESVKAACKYSKIDYKVINKKEDIIKCHGFILPGVGTFGAAIKNLKKKKIFETLKIILQKKPTLAICLGMQLLLDQSEESKGVKGFGIIKVKCKKFKKKLRVPHTGWNSVKIAKNDKIYQNIGKKSSFYFVHSYYVDILNKNIKTSFTIYENFKFISSFNYKNIFALQFHPEKSSDRGLTIYKNFKNFVNSYEDTL